MKKKMFLWIFLLVVVVAAVAYFMAQGNGEDEEKRASVTVNRADIVDKALAVGTIEPENEISVKSKISGVVKRIFAEKSFSLHRLEEAEALFFDRFAEAGVEAEQVPTVEAGDIVGVVGLRPVGLDQQPVCSRRVQVVQLAFEGGEGDGPAV